MLRTEAALPAVYGHEGFLICELAVDVLVPLLEANEDPQDVPSDRDEQEAANELWDVVAKQPEERFDYILLGLVSICATFLAEGLLATASGEKHCLLEPHAVLLSVVLLATRLA